jgi:hypothetical protein
MGDGTDTPRTEPVSPADPTVFETALMDYEEERSVEPFEARFTLGVEGDSLTVTVDGALEVVETTVG